MKSRSELQIELQTAMSIGTEAVLDLLERATNRPLPPTSKYEFCWASGQSKTLLLTQDNVVMLHAAADAGQKFCKLTGAGIINLEGLKFVIDIQGQNDIQVGLVAEKMLTAKQREEQRRDDAAALVRRAR